MDALPNLELISRYNIPAPRYTSYPTVPYWEPELWSAEAWLDRVRETATDASETGLSVYIHLPFCENLCTYCGCSTRITRNHGVEDPYILAVLKEWEMYRNAMGNVPRIREIHLGGGTPTFFAPENLHRLLEGITHGCDMPHDAELSFEAHPANTTKEHLQTLFTLGFRRLSLGIQDFDEEVQRVINRRQTEADVQRVMDDARQIGYTSVNFDLIYGLPLQTEQSMAATLQKVVALNPDRISFYSYAHVPWMKPGQRAYTEADLPQESVKLRLYSMGKDVFLKAGFCDVGMDHFAKPDDSLFASAKNGTLHRNFMGYTDRRTPLLIGLGMSSISDSGHAFVQNEKKLEHYYAAIREGRLPLMKGHLLTNDDVRIREHILDLMCRLQTKITSATPDSSGILQRLQPLQADNLVEVSGDMVRVTPAGASFLRIICMAFDLRLAMARPDSPTFSRAI